jgi:hypothetical protein
MYYVRFRGKVLFTDMHLALKHHILSMHDMQFISTKLSDEEVEVIY